MPEICRFFAIVIKMYSGDHNPPHFHIEYQDERAIFTIRDLQLIRGKLSKRATSLVLEWAFQHRDELMENWELVSARKSPLKIEPLE